MADRVEYAVSVVPIYSHSAGEGEAADVLAADVGKNLGGSGSVTCTWGNTIGYGSGSPSYVTTGTNYAVGQQALALGAFTSIKFLIIKHTGYLYSSSSVLGAETTAKLKITMAQTIADATTIAVLNPGEAIILPYNTAVTPTLWGAGDGVAIAVEIMATT